MLRDNTPSVQRAIRQYAKAFELDPTMVTEQMVEKDQFGLEHWACRGLDMSARSPTAQQMGRAFLRHPMAKESYKWLTDNLKRRFRETWAVRRDFEQVLKKRVKSIKHAVKQTEVGTWKSELQLAVHFGGANHPEAQRQARCYMEMCQHFQDTGQTLRLLFFIVGGR